MYQVLAPVVIVASAEARAALGLQVGPAARAAWQELARRGQGIEMAHFQIVHTGVTLAVSTRIQTNGWIEIALAIGDPRQAARIIPASEMRKAEAKTATRSKATPPPPRVRLVRWKEARP
jgi:hypothetical protein